MKNDMKIDIAKILKDCPRGMELDCTIWDSEAKVFLEGVLDDDFSYPIEVTVKYNNIKYTKSFTKYGAFNDLPYCKCVIFPKGKTTWEGFQRPFVDGDIICTKTKGNHKWLSIYKELEGHYLRTYANISLDNNLCFYCNRLTSNILCSKEEISEQRLATEEEKEILFQVIKANGYKWNSETNTLEELIKPRFEVKDKIKQIGSPRIYIIKAIEFDRYILNNNQFIKFADEHIYELVYDKFDINTLKLFESRVLVRDCDNQIWIPTFWGGGYLEDNCRYLTTNGCYKYCIPYEGNEHLCGKTYDCDMFYKTWEE